MLENDILPQLIEAESHIKSYWARVNEYLQAKNSPVFIWEEREFLDRIRKKINGIKLLFARLHQKDKIDLKHYEETTSNLDNLMDHLDNIRGTNQWVGQMKELLDETVLDIERERLKATAGGGVSRRGFLKGATAAATVFGTPLPARPAYAQQNRNKPKLQTPTIASESLQQKLERHIQKLRQDGKLTSDEKIALSIYDFTSEKKLAAIREDEKMQAASMIKPFVALAYFHKVARGELKYDEKVKKLMERMIRRSNNDSTNEFIDRIGGPNAVQKILRENYGGILRNTEIVQKIPKGGTEYKNKASARDYSRFLYAMWINRLPNSAELKRLMSLRKRNRITSRVWGIPDDTLSYDKTGSTARLCGDMGIIEAKDRNGKIYPYTVIAIIEKVNRAVYGTWVRARGDIIRDISAIVYQDMKKNYNLK